MRFLITSGGTREYIDPVRFISNASSGKVGCSLARAALRRGHKVTLITCPIALSPPKGVKVINVETSGQMFQAVKKNFPRCDCLIMAAAVSDYTPERTSTIKLKKGKTAMTIKLKPEFLGRINVHISTEQHQVMVKIITEIPAVKEVIEQNVQQLRVEMGNHGLEIDKFDVIAEHGSNQKEQQFGKPPGSSQGEADSGADEENYLGLLEEMDQEYEYTIATGSINYFA